MKVGWRQLGRPVVVLSEGGIVDLSLVAVAQQRRMFTRERDAGLEDLDTSGLNFRRLLRFEEDSADLPDVSRICGCVDPEGMDEPLGQLNLLVGVRGGDEEGRNGGCCRRTGDGVQFGG